MNSIVVLAQASVETAQRTGKIVPIDFIYHQITLLTWLQAVIAVSFGVVYLMYGWRIFKALTVISFALLGLYGGMTLGQNFGEVFLGGLTGLILLGLLSIPLMRWGVSILGGIAGGILTAGIWYAFNLPEQYIWAGGLVGVVAGGMISFIVFKVAVMLFSSLGGSAIVVTGFLALLHHYEPTTVYVKDLIYNNNWFLPIALLLPTVIGVIVQNKLIKGSHDWQI